MTFHRKWIIALGAGLLAAIGAAGVLYAQSGSGTITACFKNQNGQLRLIDPLTTGCLPSETQISWNQTGPQGPQGVQGPVGPTGPRGPSDAYDGFKFPGNNTAVTSSDPAHPTRVLAFTIPAGAFAITSKVNISAGTSGGGLVHCTTQTANGWFDMGIASIGPNAGETLESTESTTFTAQETAPGLLTIDCWRINGVGNAPIAGLAEAVAIQVANAHVIGF